MLSYITTERKAVPVVSEASSLSVQTTSTVTKVSTVSNVSKMSGGPRASTAFRVAMRTKSKVPTESLTATTGRKLDSAETEKLIIGLDFGTTYTGIAYGLTSDPTRINVIKVWPGNGRNDTVKVPSIIKYGDMEDDDLEPIDFDWGYGVSENDEGVIRGIKLGLDPDKRKFWASAVGINTDDDLIHLHEQTTKSELVRLCKSTVDIVSDYIGAVYEHALSKIRERELSSIVNSLPKQFVITVPAIWSDMAKNATLRAARNAHPDILVLGPGDLVTEPEAAALYTVQSFQKRGFRKGDAFVLCDAGGGTVDLISYQITSMRPKMKLKELVSATGGAVGSMMINNGFERYLRGILDDEVFETLKGGDGTSFNAIMNDFDFKIKPRFSSATEWDNNQRVDDKITFPGVYVPDDEDKNIKENTLRVTGTVLDGIFDPLVTATEDLVREQIDGVIQKITKAPKAIFLVGGFGSSPYLSRRLRETARSINPEIDVVQPEEAWSAVVRGAVLYKMPNTISVVSSVAPVSLGVMANVPYDAVEHPKSAIEHMFMDEHEGIERIPKMTWFIYKDSDMDRDQKVRFTFYRDVPYDYEPEHLIFEDELEESDAAIPPTYPWEGTKRKCVLTSDLSSLTKDQLEEEESLDGTKYYSVHYDLVISIESAGMTFSVECQNKVYSITDVDY